MYENVTDGEELRWKLFIYIGSTGKDLMRDRVQGRAYRTVIL